MRYQYHCQETGENAHIDLPMDQAPEIGHEIKQDGKVFVRVYSVHEAAVPQAFTARNKGVTSSSLPRHWKYHKGLFDAAGKPQFASRAEAENACARASHEDGTDISFGQA